jgi:hypothetical protein
LPEAELPVAGEKTLATGNSASGNYDPPFLFLVRRYGLFPGPVGGGSGVDSMLGAESS